MTTELVNHETGEIVDHPIQRGIPGNDPVVYVLVGDDDRTLYVGSTRDVARRVREHRSKSWWHEVADVEIYPMQDWELALFVERNLIRKLAPRHNRQSNDLVSVVMAEFLGPRAHRLIEGASC